MAGLGGQNNPFADPRTNNIFQSLNARVSEASAAHRIELEVYYALLRLYNVI